MRAALARKLSAPGHHALGLSVTRASALLIAEGDVAAVSYRERRSGPVSPVSDAASFTSTLLAEINRVRSEAKLPP